ncbi:RNA recognition motif 2-domain-containing protein [Flagelloscypha sp. PMI_526]|nr:RNA recognition motif 2-domain-containing protein [Flagelloscypha sp. PMI_526]
MASTIDNTPRAQRQDPFDDLKSSVAANNNKTKKERPPLQHLLTPPLTPASSINSAASSSTDSETAEDNAVNFVLPEIDPSATNFLLIGQLAKTCPDEVFYRAINETLHLIQNVLAPCNEVGGERSEIIRARNTRRMAAHGEAILAFYDIRHAIQARELLVLPGTLSASCVDPAYPTWSCQFLTRAETVQLIGSSKVTTTRNDIIVLWEKNMSNVAEDDDAAGKITEVGQQLRRLLQAQGALRSFEHTICQVSSHLFVFLLFSRFSLIQNEIYTFRAEFLDYRDAVATQGSIDGTSLLGSLLRVFQPSDEVCGSFSVSPSEDASMTRAVFQSPGLASQTREPFYSPAVVASCPNNSEERCSDALPTHGIFYATPASGPPHSATPLQQATPIPWFGSPPSGTHIGLTPRVSAESAHDGQYLSPFFPFSTETYLSPLPPHIPAHFYSPPPPHMAASTPAPQLFFHPAHMVATSPPMSYAPPTPYAPPAPTASAASGFEYETPSGTVYPYHAGAYIYDPSAIVAASGYPLDIWHHRTSPPSVSGTSSEGEMTVPSQSYYARIPVVPSFFPSQTPPSSRSNSTDEGPTLSSADPTISHTSLSPRLTSRPGLILHKSRLPSTTPEDPVVTSQCLERNQLNIAKIQDGQDTRTTVMIKNIPNKMSDKDLINYISKVCPRRIDFLYLRMDFKNGCNVGYAFVNFITVEDLLTFAKSRLGEKWNMFSSEKVLQMSYANYQGKEALIEKFKNSCIMDEREAWRPKIFWSDGPEQGLPQEFPPPTHLRRKERSSFNRGALYVPGVHNGGLRHPNSQFQRQMVPRKPYREDYQSRTAAQDDGGESEGDFSVVKEEGFE